MVLKENDTYKKAKGGLIRNQRGVANFKRGARLNRKGIYQETN